MKKIIFCLLFFALCVGASAQLTYTYCPPSNTLPPAYASATRQILSAFGVFPDNIALAGNSEFAIAGGGDYTPFGRRSDGKTPSLKREYTGLSMEVQARGLTCDNCTVTSLAGSPIIGTKQNPAVILAAPGTFSGNIVLKGACNFTITGTGIFRLSGVISGAGPLTYNAPDAGNIGNNAGIFLEGTAANTYSGQTTIAGGYVVCNKSNGTLSVPGNVAVSAAAGNLQAYLWCQTDNQLGSGAIVDFSGAQTHSYMHLNGTSQTIVGLKSDNDKGIVENHDGAGHWASVVSSPPAGYSVLTIKNDGDPENPLVFAGVIRDHAAGVPLNANSAGSGGISLLKTGKGTQVLTGVNLYTGATTVSAGILRLEGNGLLGGGVYEGTLEISNTAGGNDSENIFEHKGDRTQVFNGKITNNAGAGKLGMFMQSGTGKSIINNAKDFTANVLVWKGFLGGSGDLSKVASMYVLGVGGFGTPPAGVGGGDGTDGHGATLTVPNLNLGGAFSKLVITSRPDRTPSLLAAKDKATGETGPIVNSSQSPFTADVLGGPDLVSGYVIKCTNGVSDNIPPPTLGVNNTGKTVFFKWDNTGLYMLVGGVLTCDNCTFTPPGSNTPVSGAPGSPAVILAAPGTFSGNIALNGACNFTITGTGIFRLSGVISGAGPLTYNAPDAGNIGNNAGIFLEGTAGNTYSGQTTIAGGYVVCNKSNGTLSVPGNVAVSAAAGNVQAHLWCQTDNQLGSGAIVDFSGAQTRSYMHLNGTSQTVGGLKSDNDKGIAENNDGAGRWTSVINSPPAGYSVLTIKNDEPRNPLAFAGVIRDNAAGVTVNANRAGSGGISLLKTGNGIQILTGVNLYTGTTTVSAGALRLEGNGLLGGGVYEGTLEISNTEIGGSSQRIFEYRGDRTQVFNGNITNNANAGASGIFLQSGTGKSIINNAKDFTGKVSVWGGFLGGSGDLSKASFMSVGDAGVGGVGGGDGTNGHGAELTVPNLSFGASSKLTITSRPDRTPSLLVVKDKATGAPGTISISKSPFTADVLGGADLVSGYVIKCANGVSDNIPLPILGTNNTGKTVCFTWDNTGLFMRVGS